MDRTESMNGRTIVAAAVGIGLLVCCGVGYRVAAAYLAGPAAGRPLPPGALAKLPMQIGDWRGKEAPLDEAVVRAADTDAHISRTYSKPGRAENAWLYVAYGLRARDLMPHRPEVCYPGNGWTLDDNRTVQLPLADGTTLQCRILRFSRSGLNDTRITVLNYYIVDGKYCPDVSLLRSAAWRGSSGVRYMAEVQIACTRSGSSGAAAAEKVVRDLASDSAHGIYGLFENAGEAPERNAAPPSAPSRREANGG